VRLVDLRDRHFRDLAAAMRKINTPAADGDPSDLLRRLLDARATRAGKRFSTRSLTDARIRRVLAVASSALGGLVPHTLPFNPAASVKAGKGRRRKPLLWTAARAERWRETGEIPASFPARREDGAVRVHVNARRPQHTGGRRETAGQLAA
jgi:hypothetical protein